jgi:asparagine synthase (glutamine-hydrolysing)
MMHKVAAQMEYLYALPLATASFFLEVYSRNEKQSLSSSPSSKRLSEYRSSRKKTSMRNSEASTLYRPESYKSWTRTRAEISYWRRIMEAFTQSIIDFDLLYNTIPDNFLVKVDRASMTHSLEVRSPFLDYRFVELARRIPVKWKVTTNKTKILMRDIIAGIVPDTIVSRPKQGFEPPIAEWILGDAYIASMKKWLEELFSQGILSTEWYSFYKDSVFSGNNQVFNVFKIKLFLLLKWQKQWIK